jgi:hypothetical protein
MFVMNVYDNVNSSCIKIKQMQYLSYNANRLQQSLDLKTMVNIAMVQPTILSSHTLINKCFALIISIYSN